MSLTSTREACSAGIKPKTMPVPSDTPRVNSEHTPVDAHERAVLPTRGRSGGVQGEQGTHADQAESQAEHAAAPDNTTLSVSS